MFIEELGKNPAFFWGMVLVIIFSICFHELAHGLVAVWLGDDTPIEEGRLTLSPFVHMGLFSLICLLVAGIAWGAMPVNENRLRGRYGVALVAIAGPATNVLLAGLALGGLGLWMRADPRASADLPQMAQNARYLLWRHRLRQRAVGHLQSDPHSPAGRQQYHALAEPLLLNHVERPHGLPAARTCKCLWSHSAPPAGLSAPWHRN